MQNQVAVAVFAVAAVVGIVYGVIKLVTWVF